jgi:hypothetical protein
MTDPHLTGSIKSDPNMTKTGKMLAAQQKENGVYEVELSALHVERGLSARF